MAKTVNDIERKMISDALVLATGASIEELLVVQAPPPVPDPQVTLSLGDTVDEAMNTIQLAGTDWNDAVKAYEQAIAADRRLADAYFNLARLYEQAGKRAAALRNLSKYRLLTGE